MKTSIAVHLNPECTKIFLIFEVSTIPIPRQNLNFGLFGSLVNDARNLKTIGGSKPKQKAVCACVPIRSTFRDIKM